VCTRPNDISWSRDVVVCYEQPSGLGANAINKVSLDIKPGQLVVIVGDNGSGKSSLLKLITKLVCPTSGNVKIDGKDIETYDLNRLRRSIAFLSQHEEIYPVSLAENVLMGVPNLTEKHAECRGLVDEATRLGGAYDLVQKLGYEKVVNPPSIVGLSFQGCGNGPISDQAVVELDYYTAHRKGVKLSDAEKQRLVAYVFLFARPSRC
jgi:ABC-type multidrug transport system fused ATPase/permease subunit